MSLQPCEQVNNIHEGKLYSKTFTYTNNTSSSVSWQNFLYWLNGQINSLLDSLPDGYAFVPIMLLNYRAQINGVDISTSGGSHSVTINADYAYLNYTNGNYASAIYRTHPAAQYCHYGELAVNASTNAVTMTDRSSTEAVAPNSTRDATIEFILYTKDTTMPTD